MGEEWTVFVKSSTSAMSSLFFITQTTYFLCAERIGQREASGGTIMEDHTNDKRFMGVEVRGGSALVPYLEITGVFSAEFQPFLNTGPIINC